MTDLCVIVGMGEGNGMAIIRNTAAIASPKHIGNFILRKIQIMKLLIK